MPVCSSSGYRYAASFTSGQSKAQKLNGFGDMYFAGAQWTDNEIIAVDVALNNLHHHVGNTTLLETAFGGDVEFQRIGKQSRGPSILGWNDSRGGIALTDAAFKNDLSLWTTIYHEVGHNWDDSHRALQTSPL